MKNNNIHICNDSNRVIQFASGIAYEISVSDTNIFNVANLYVGTGGNVKVTMADANVVTFKNVPSGTFMPILITQVWSTGTTASDFIIVL